ncbi:DUF4231 domain-containing protein [Halomonas chromatireducens]|uniref:DUF4231 domain-containing protein n=1 Tax=Halomonas chromatireducens TaxID=507626 RepID=A0A0X8HFN7_9GAMM|nr:DUF4231 domain-containing protein [Halomonas chromatireducens]AMD01786.1 hypothetical protein LOKO_02733 [Halomonas chromatireducens]
METNDYPALYRSADRSSSTEQHEYLSLLRTEYGLLIFAAILSMGFSEHSLYHVLYALVFVLAAAVLLFRAVRKPEQDWYRCRALAESIKTSTWRYMMRAEPFVDAPTVQVPRAEFRNFLAEILRANRHIGSGIADELAAEHQITPRMEEIRSLDLEARKKMYKEQRIDNQRKWYAKKSSDNREASKIWVVATILVYIAATVTVLLKIAKPEWILLPTEPLIVLAASFIGWIQIKKFNELASAYALTAHEIGILQPRLDEINDEVSFSDFVNEAELAFSREHTQWVARQHQE